MTKGTRLQRLSGSYLILTARVTCRACWESGRRGQDAWVIDPRLCPTMGGPLSPTWRRAIVRAAVKHYGQLHPAIELP